MTLDTNILIDIEEQRPGYLEILKLKKLNDSNKINLRLVAISASEKIIDGERIQSFDVFKYYFKTLGFNNIELLLPFAIWDITFWGQSIWASDKMTNLEQSIHEILFPNIAYLSKELKLENDIVEEKLLKTWRNSRCDSLVLWSHIYYQGDIFVTNDNNFHKQTKKMKLIEIGAKNIKKSEEIINFVS